MYSWKKVGWLLLWVAPLMAQDEAVVTLTAPQILEKCEVAYKRLESYQGMIVVWAEECEGEGQEVNPVEFTQNVQCQRPDKLRFGSTGPRGISLELLINSDRYSLWSTDNLQEYYEENLSAGRGVFAGLSITGTVLPFLLLNPAQFQEFHPFQSRDQARLEGEEKIRSWQTYRISLPLPRVGQQTLWIDTTNYLVRQRRLELNLELGEEEEEETELQGSLVTTEAYLPIILNRPIAEEVFLFTPPSGAEKTSWPENEQ